jgi:transcriptional regulator with XRE-family HTH domain
MKLYAIQDALMTEAPTLQALRECIATEVGAEMTRQGKTQDDLAAAVGISQSRVSYRLRAVSAFHAEELILIARWLGVPVTQFLLEPAGVAS